MTFDFADDIVAAGRPTAATVTIHNPNPSLALTGVGVSNLLPSGLVVATPNGVTNTCNGAVFASSGAANFSLTGGTAPANGNCAFSVNVVGTTPGAKNDTTGAVTSTQTGAGGTGNDSVTIVVPPTAAVAFGAPALSNGGSTPLTFTLANPAANPSTLHGVGFTDTLPAGLVVDTPNGVNNTCFSGTMVADSGTKTIKLSGVTLGSGQTCTFAVNVKATAGGQQDTSTGPVISDEGGAGASASASVVIPHAPSLAIAFGDPAIAVGALTSLTFTLTNDNTGRADRRRLHRQPARRPRAHPAQAADRRVRRARSPHRPRRWCSPTPRSRPAARARSRCSSRAERWASRTTPRSPSSRPRAALAPRPSRA